MRFLERICVTFQDCACRFFCKRVQTFTGEKALVQRLDAPSRSYCFSRRKNRQAIGVQKRSSHWTLASELIAVTKSLHKTHSFVAAGKGICKSQLTFGTKGLQEATIMSSAFCCVGRAQLATDNGTRFGFACGAVCTWFWSPCNRSRRTPSEAGNKVTNIISAVTRTSQFPLFYGRFEPK